MPIEATVRGRDLVTGLPREIVITDADIREAITHSIDTLVEAVREVLETTPPEVLADVMQKGIHLTGGGALIRGMPEFLSAILQIPVYRAQDPLSSVVRGTGVIIENLPQYVEVLIESEDALSPGT
jgi:rod shape-determining protein MreB